MKCSISGCYATPFRKNLCRNHFYVWRDQLPATAPRRSKGDSELTPAPTPRTFRSQHDMPYNGPCRCETPRPQRIPMFGCCQCANCGMPLPTERITHEAV